MKRAALPLLLAIACAACSPSATASPSSAPSPTGTTVAIATAFAPKQTAEVKWSVATGGSIWGSVAVHDGVAYVGSNDGNLYAVDAATGAVRWKFATQGEVRTTPAFTADAVVFASDDGNVYAVDASGKERWRSDIHSNLKRRPLDDPNANYDFDFLASSPVVSGDWVFAGSSDGSVYALDASTGKVAWTYKTGDKVRASAVVSDGLVYVGSWDGYVYALKAASGELAWKYNGAGTGEPKYLYTPIQSTATVMDGIVYCASRKAALFALDAKTGTERWTMPNGGGNWYESSPVVANGHIFIGSSAGNTLYSYDAGGFMAGTWNLAAAVWSTPVVAGEVAFVGAEDFQNTGNGGIYAVDVKAGIPSGVRWSIKATETLEPSAMKIKGVNSSPLLVDATLYFGGLDGKIYALSV